MTVRQAELLMAIATVLLSLGLMWSSTDGLSISWVPNKGPGSGFWPFYLSIGLLLASLATLYRWFRRATPESRSEEPYISGAALTVVGVSVAALLGLLIGIHLVGMYISLFVFMLFYVKVIGRHPWGITVCLVGGTPLFVFGMFEWALQIPLPKAITEEWFYPVFDIMYGTSHFWAYMLGAAVIVAVLGWLTHKFIDPQPGTEEG
ncbi:MAG: tripartite tricarboxylate transporter TctB family protein [Pseudomonadota bacterium]